MAVMMALTLSAAALEQPQLRQPFVMCDTPAYVCHAAYLCMQHVWWCSGCAGARCAAEAVPQVSICLREDCTHCMSCMQVDACTHRLHHYHLRFHTCAGAACRYGFYGSPLSSQGV